MASTIVKKVTVGVPISGVTSGAFSINNLAGVDITGVGTGDMLVYDASTSKFLADSDTYLKTADSAEIKSLFSAGGDLTYDSASGQFSFDVESVYTKANFDSDLVDATVAGTLRFADGSASAPSVSNTDDTNTGMFFPTADTIGFSVGGTSQVQLSDGFFGPTTDSDVDLGSSTKKFKDLYLSGGSIHIGGLILSDNNNTLKISDSAGTEILNTDVIDGTTSATSTTIADADRLVLNDNGTMVQVAVTDLAAYLDDEITAMPNLVTTAATTVGALNSGSITSGFGSIDVGASAITTTGLISGGSLDIDDVVINSGQIGHTNDTDLITLASGIVTIAGEISVTTLDIGGTNVTATGAELNILDGVTSTASELNILDGVTATTANLNLLDGANVTTAEINIIDGNTAASSTTVVDADRVVFNDDGTMKQVAVTDLAAYFDDEITAMPNLVSVGALDTGSITSGFGAIDNGTSGIRTATFTAETAFVPDASDGASLGTSSLEFSDLFLADGAVISLGDDDDVTLTHIPDTGLRLNSTMALQFNDASQFINAPSATVLDINATDEVEINATLADINANLDVSGTYTGGGLMTTGGNIVIPDGGYIGAASDTDAIQIEADGDIVMSQDLRVAGNLTVTGTTTQVNTVTMEAANAVVFEGATADDHETTLTVVDPTADRTINLPNVSGTLPVLAAVSTTQITSTPEELNILDGVTSTATELNLLDGVTSTTTELNIVDGNTSATSTTVVDADRVVFNDDGTMKQVAVTDLAAYFDDEITAMPNLVSVGALDTGSITSGFGAIDNGTSGIRTNTFTAETSFVPSAQDGAALGTTSLQFSDLFLADGAVIGMGDDNEVTLTHVADTGILLNSTMQLQFNDASQYINAPSATVLDINATDEIELNATLIDVNGNLDISGTTVSAGKITADAGIDIDNFNIDGTTIALSSGDLLVDVAGDINLDAAGGNFKFSVSGTQILDIGNSSSDVIIKPTVDSKDIIFQQYDGTEVARIEDNATFNVVTGKLAINGTAITSTAAELNILDGVTSTAAELNILDGDTSATSTTVADADRVVFNDNGTMKQVAMSDINTYISAGSTVNADDINAGDSDVAITTTSGGITIGPGASDADIIFKGNDGGSEITALTLDISAAGKATFNNEIVATALDISGDVDIDGTLEADAITVNGATLAETISDTVGAMVGSNTETGITVTYQDGDNTLDFALGAAQTTITSLLATDIKIGEDDQTKIDFETADEIHFYVDNAHQIKIVDGAIMPATDNDIDLGTSSVEFKNAYFDGTVTSDAFAGPLTGDVIGDVTGNVSGTAATVTGAAQSNITSLGTLTTLTVDNVIVNGTTIGHTDDTDLITLADGIATVAGEISVTTLDIGGTNVTSTAAELNILDGVTSTAAELNILDGVTATAAELNILDGDTSATSTTVADADRVVLNDNGTMKQVAMTDINTYVSSGATVKADDIQTGDAAVTITTSSGNITIDAAANDTDIIFKGTDGGADTTFLTIDGSAAGAATFNDKITAVGTSVFTNLDISGDVDVDGTLEADAITLGGTSLATSATTDTTNASNIGSGTLAAARMAAAQTAITSILATDVKIGEDDQTKIDFETADEIHFYAANAHQIKLVDGALVPATDNDVDLGTSSAEFKNAYFDGTVTSDAFAGPLTGDVTGNVSGSAATVTGAAQSAITSLGTLTTLTVDDITINGATITATDTFTIDAAADIIIDAGGGDILFKDDGTESGRIISRVSGELSLSSEIDDADIKFKGKDGGSTITALTLDMSDSGTATFNHDIKLGDGGKAIFGAGSDLEIFHDGSNSFINNTVTGALSIKSDDINLMSSGSETMATFVENGAVTLYNDNAARFATDAEGANVTGTLDVSSRVVVAGGTEATSTSDGSIATAGGLSVAKDVVAGNDVSLLSDGAVLGFGADKEVTLTHIHNAGLRLNSTFALQFNDASQYIYAPSGAILDIHATDEIELNATLVDINANVEISGNLTVAGTTTQVDTVTMNAQNAVVFEGATADAHETTLTIIDPTADRTINLPNVGGHVAVFAAEHTTQITSTPAELNILDGVTSTATELNLLDGSTANSVVNSKAVVYGSSGELAGTLSTAAQTNITSLGTLTALTVDEMTLDGDTLTATDTFTIDAVDDITLNCDNSGRILFGDASVIYGIASNSSSNFVLEVGTNDKDMLFKGQDNGSTITALTLDMSDAGTATFNHDVKLNDNSEIVLGTDGDFKIFCDNSANYIRSQTSDMDLSLVVNDGGNILTALTFDASDAGTATFSHDVNMGDNCYLKLGAGNDLELSSDGTNGKVFVQNGNLTLDVAGDINLDADGGDILFKDGGTTFGSVINSSSDFQLNANVQDKDIKFTGNDGGSGITALTLDMSQAGRATFNEGIVAKSSTAGDFGLTLNTTSGDSMKLSVTDTGTGGGADGIMSVSDGDLTLDVAGDITLDADGGDIIFKDGGTLIGTIGDFGNNNVTIKSEVSDGDIKFQGNDGGSGITALTLDMSAAGAATFNDKIIATELDISGNADIDGTMEADAYTVNGTALAEYIADTVGAMVGSNTESGISVVYQDADNTLDFTVGTLNQNTTGSAATLTTGRTIGMTGDVVWTSASFNGSGNVTGTSTIQSGAVETGMIAADAITGAKIADDTINSEHYAAGSIDNEHIADNAINSEHYADGSIDTAHYADNSITEAKMANDAIGSAELKSLATLLILDSAGSTLRTFHCAGA